MSLSRLITFGVFGGAATLAFVYFYATSGRRSGAKKRGLSGLYNLGNTCYANALIQGLSSIPSIVSWLRRLHCDDNDETRFVQQLKKLILELDAVRGDTLSAHDVSEALRSHGWTIGHGTEQDLHELLNVFLTTWEEELAFARQRKITGGLLEIADIKRDEEEDEKYSKIGRRAHLAMEKYSTAVRLHYELRAPCTGITATQLKCAVPSCSFKKIRHDSCSVIPLTIPKSLRGMRLRVETLLRDYFRLEVIRGATCDACKLRSGKTDSGLIKNHGFAKLPPALIIRIERVGMLPSGAVYKVDDHVDFAETLDVRDFCFYRSKEADYDKSAAESRTPERTSRIVGGASGGTTRNAFSSSTNAAASLPFRGNASIDGGSYVAENVAAARYRYQLRAVSEHRGHAQSGHFITYRRGLPSNSHAWFLTNDSQVSRVSYQQVANSQAYMLYYERMKITNNQ